MGRIPKYRTPRTELYAQGTGTTSVVLTIPRGPQHTELTVIDHILATTINGTAGAAHTIQVGDAVVLREQLTATGSAYAKIDLDGAWPVWRTSGDSEAVWGGPTSAAESHIPPPSGSVTYLPIYGGSAASGELNQRTGQSFLLDQDRTIDGIGFWLRRTGQPTDTFRITLRETSITGTVLSTVEVSSADINPQFPKFYVFNLPTPVALLGLTPYYVQLLRLGSRNTSNYIEAYATTNSVYGNGGAYTFDNNVWSSESATVDLGIQFYAPLLITYTAPALSTGSCVTAMYHYEKASLTRN